MSIEPQAFPRYRTAARSSCSSLAAHDRIATLERVSDLGAAVPLAGNTPEGRCGIDRVFAIVRNRVLLPSLTRRRKPAVRRVYLCW
jgi:hypothetical protein